MFNKLREVMHLTKGQVLVSLLLLSVSMFSLAETGISFTAGTPKFSNGENRSYFTDMRMVYEGGSFSYERYWTGKRWIFNRDWAPLLLVRNDDPSYPADVNKLTDTQINKMSEGAGLPNFILMNGQPYSSNGFSDNAASYISFHQNSIIVLFEKLNTETPQIIGYLWRNKQGDQKAYDAEGKLIWAGLASKPKRIFEYNEVGDLQLIKDSQGQTLLTISYEDIPLDARTDFNRSPYRVTQIKDYTNRTVDYTYLPGSGKLNTVKDVRNETWTMRYNDKHFIGYIDPENRKTTIDIDLEGRLRSYKNSDGVGETYSYDYNKGKERFFVKVQTATGKVTEAEFDFTGYPVGRSINGDVVKAQSKAIYSDGTAVSGTEQLVAQTRRLWLSNKNAGACGSAPAGIINSATATGTLSSLASGNQGSSTGSFVLQQGIDNSGASEPVGSGGQVIDHGELSTVSCRPAGIRLYVKERQVRDERGLNTRYFYNQFKENTSVENADGTIHKKTYIEIPGYGRRLSEETTPENVTFKYVYDEKGQLISQIDAVGSDVARKTSYSYNLLGQLKSTTYHATLDGDGQSLEDAIWQYEYDNFGNLNKITDPLNYITQYNDHDALGNPHSIIDANSYIQKRSYDESGNLISDTNPYNQGVYYTYDKSGFRKTSRSDAGDTLSMLVNANGLPKEITDSLNHINRLNYDLDNRPTLIQDQEGNTQRFFYDSRGRIEQYIDAENNKSLYSYENNLLSQIKYPTYVEAYEYDKGDRTIETLRTSSHNGSNISYLTKRGYNIPGRTESISDANENLRTTHYDELGRIKTLVDEEGGSTHFIYDNRDNLLQVIDPEQRNTIYTYNLRNQLTSETKQLQLGSEEKQRYLYDKSGNRTHHINAKGEVVLYQYDQANRLFSLKTFVNKTAVDAYTAETPSGTPIKTLFLSYNSKGQFSGYSDSNSTETRSYNTRGELSSITVNFGGFSKTALYTYKPNGDVASYTSPENQVYSYSYNKNNQINSIAVAGKGIITFGSYDWLQHTTLTLPGGSKISYSHDGLLRQQKRIFSNPAGENLSTYQYSYDGESNITAMAETTDNFDDEKSSNYGYDKLNRITDITTPVENTQYSYDGVGNRTQVRGDEILSADYNANNQLSVYGTASYIYDANGNTSTRIDTFQRKVRKTEYIYDVKQRLIEVKMALTESVFTSEELQAKTTEDLKSLAVALNPQNIVYYVYNGYGQRVKKITNTGTTYYFYSEQGLAAEYDSSGNLLVEYHYKPNSTWMTNPATQLREGVLYFYQNDHLGTPQRLIKTNGKVVWHADYKVFGETLITSNEIENNLRFPGQYYDEETGSYYNFHRDYDPSLGRYLESDPIGLDGGINFYNYANQNSLKKIDPSGEFPLWMLIKAIQIGVQYGHCVKKCMDTFQNPCPIDLESRVAGCLASCVVTMVMKKLHLMKAKKAWDKAEKWKKAKDAARAKKNNDRRKRKKRKK